MAERIRYSGFPPEAFNSLVGQLVSCLGLTLLRYYFAFYIIILLPRQPKRKKMMVIMLFAASANNLGGNHIIDRINAIMIIVLIDI